MTTNNIKEKKEKNLQRRSPEWGSLSARGISGVTFFDFDRVGGKDCKLGSFCYFFGLGINSLCLNILLWS